MHKFLTSKFGFYSFALANVTDIIHTSSSVDMNEAEFHSRDVDRNSEGAEDSDNENSDEGGDEEEGPNEELEDKSADDEEPYKEQNEEFGEETMDLADIGVGGVPFGDEMGIDEGEQGGNVLNSTCNVSSSVLSSKDFNVVPITANSVSFITL